MQQLESDSRWASTQPTSPSILSPVPPRAPPEAAVTAQAQPAVESGTPAPPATADAAPDPAEAALKAEMERRWSDAERLYRDMLASGPQRVDVLLRLSDVQAAQGKRLEAARTLARAADLRPGDVDLQRRTSEAFGAADSPAEAARYNDRALDIRPDDQGLLRRRAQLSTWAGDLTQAAAALRKLIEADPGDQTLKRELGQIQDTLLARARNLSEQGDKAAALQLLDQYRDAGGSDETYRRERAQAEADPNAPLRAEMGKRWDEAERLYREALAKEPNRADLLLRLTDVLAVQGKRLDAAQALQQAADLRPEDGDLQLRASEALAVADRPADALRYVDRALSVRPGDLGLHRRRAQLGTWAGQYPQAEESLRILMKANPNELTLQRDLGRVLSWQGRLNDAVKLLSDYVAQRPADQEALLDLARLQAARGNAAAAADLLKRYRDAGGEERTYQRERERLRAPVRVRPGAAARQPALAAPSSKVPPAAVRAEMGKRWGEAERVYRDILRREPNRLDLLLRLADVLVAQRKRLQAAQALAKAADLRPADSDRQLRASEAFAVADRPVDALHYVDRALAARPGDLGLHRRRAQLAIWAGKNPEAEQSLRLLIAADPNELTLRRDLGRVLGWQGHSDISVEMLSDYVEQRPTDKDAVLDLARMQAARGNSDAAVRGLDRYREIGGEESIYRRDLALFLAWAGRPRAALELAAAGLAADPADFQYRFARAAGLRDGFEYGSALSEVGYLARLRPGAPELDGLRRSIEVPRRPYLQLDTNPYHGSDGIFSVGSELTYSQPVSDAWWVMAGAGALYISADPGTAFAPIQGGTFMARGSGWLGAQARLDYATMGSLRAGATATGRGGAEPIWQASIDNRWSDSLRVQLVNTRDLQTVSPRSVSLGIMRIDTEAELTYTPDLLWTTVAIAREAEFSDGNRYLRGYIAPRRAVLRTQYWNVDLGVSGNFYSYRDYPPQNGYYAPSFYQQYATNTYVYYKMSDDDGISLVVTVGAHKDETMNSFKLSTGLYTEATFGLLSDWMCKIRAGYTNSGSSAGRNFSAEAAGLTLVRRF
jgi:predicted Zn-dependent protease